MYITESPSTLHITISMFNTGFAPAVDENEYPGMGYIIVDQNDWSVSFALWHQSVLSSSGGYSKILRRLA